VRSREAPDGVVIRWKDIYNALAHALDACEEVAHVLEGIALRARHCRARRR
jgi:uncharacterized protein Yka (UPF0111/DUF47 family)